MNIFSYLPYWGFRATKTVYGSDNTVVLNNKSGSSTSLKDLVNGLPSVSPSTKLKLNPLLFNGILQTMYYGGSNKQPRFKVWYGRELFTFLDGGICSLDWVKDPESEEEFNRRYQETLPEGWPRLFPRTRFYSKEEVEQLRNNKDETKPLVVILHGLAGGSHEALVRNFAELLTTGKNKDKFDVVVNMSRGCGRTKITSGKLFNALSTQDVHEVLTELKSRYPNRHIYAVGFSFGALLLTNYLGKYPEESRDILKAAAIVGCPFDLKTSSKFIQSTWSGYYLFDRSILSFLNRLVKSNLKELVKHESELFNEKNLAITMAAKQSNVFDETFTCKISGFDTAEQYYEAASTRHSLPHVSVPLLSISSSDDPTLGPSLPVEMIKANANTVAVETDLGGHLAFVTPEKEFWCVRVIDEFLEAIEDTE